MPLFLLALLGLRVVAGFPGIVTPHTHGGSTHTHPSGGMVHEHPSNEEGVRGGYPIRIAVRERPIDWEHTHTHDNAPEHAHLTHTGEPRNDNDTRRPQDGEHDHGRDRNNRHESYYCAASLSLLATESISLPLPPAVSAGVFLACTQVKRRAVWRTQCPRGPPESVRPIGIVFS
jgi:hypothetical protein